MPIANITHVPIVVRDQDEALAWFTEKFGLVVCEDNADLVADYRWLTVSPAADRSTRFILMPPQEEGAASRVGASLMCVLASDDVKGDCQAFAEKGVRIVDGPADAPWGTTATVLDLYGNPYYLVQAPTRP